MGLIFENSYYSVVEAGTWDTAQEKASNLGGYLVCINNTIESIWLGNEFSKSKYSYDSDNELFNPEKWAINYFWVGGKLNSENQWTWVSEEYFNNSLYSLSIDNDNPNHNRLLGVFNNDLPSQNIYLDDVAPDNKTIESFPYIPLYKGIAEIPLSYFSIADTTVIEGEIASIEITRQGGINTIQNIILSTVDGSASTGSDFIPLNQTITFLEGEISKTIYINTLEDFLNEGDENFTVNLNKYDNDIIPSQILDNSANVIINDKFVEEISYSINPSSYSIDEGKVLSIEVKTSNIDTNTTIYWELQGVGITASDFNSEVLTGSGEIDENGKYSFSLEIKNDITTEGEELLWINLFSDSDRLINIAQSYNIYINDTSTLPFFPIDPSYFISTSSDAISEGNVLTSTINTLNVLEGTKVYWELYGEYIDSSDFYSGELEGIGIIDENGGFSFSHTIAKDFKTEGTEVLNIALFSDPARYKHIADIKDVKINDTSYSSNPSYLVITSSNSIDEGDILTTNVKTSNLSDWTTVYWELIGDNINSSDFQSGDLIGSAAINENGEFSFFHTIANDQQTEGDEFLQINLYSDSSRSTQVGNSVSVKINDKSYSLIPSYLLTTSSNSVDEGDILTTKVKTLNLPAGETIYWEINGENINLTDFYSGSMIGSGQIDENGELFFYHTIANDLKTEGDEFLSINIFSDNDRINNIGSIESIKINDTSVFSSAPLNPSYIISTSGKSINEGDILTTTINSSNVLEGTRLYWELKGKNINSTDFQTGGLTGSGLVDENGSFSFSHAIANDFKEEGNEEFDITLFSEATHIRALKEWTDFHNQLAKIENIIIKDTSHSNYSLSLNNPSIFEGDSNTNIMTFILELNKDATFPININYEILDTGSATPGEDFDPASGIINFTKGQNVGFLDIIFYGDIDLEFDETINIKFSSNNMRNEEIATGLILDDDFKTIISFEKDFNEYMFYHRGNDKYEIKNGDLIDDLTGVSKLIFQGNTFSTDDDITIEVLRDIKGTFDQITGKEDHTGQMFRLYNAAFARFPDADGLAYWIDMFGSGVNTKRQIANSFLGSDEFAKRYGANVSDSVYVDTLYTNVLGRLPDAEGKAYWLERLTSGVETRAEALLGFAESDENKILFSDMTGVF